MPYAKMTGLDLPEDIATVWRYMDFSKYMSMLVTEGVYFVRCDRFEDKWDSVLPRRWHAQMSRDRLPTSDGRELTEAEWYTEKEIPTRPVSCWHVHEHEDDAMWKRYTPTESTAVAIRSTVAQLKQSFSSCAEEVRIGLVKYGDHEELGDPKFSAAYWGSEPSPAPLNPWYRPQFFKRKFFELDRELRAMVYVSPSIEHGHLLKIGVDGLRALIQSVHLKPGSSKWFKQVVESVTARYGLPATPVCFSEIDVAPPG